MDSAKETTSGGSDGVIRVDVAILGGGLAGLTTAVALVKRGLRVAVVERGGILGGRARSWTDARTGDPVTIGPHIFLTEYPNVFKLLELLGTRDRIVWQGGKRFITLVQGERQVVMRQANLPPPMTFVPSVLGDPTASLHDKLSNLRATSFAIRMTEADVLALDSMNALDFLRSMGVTERYIQSFWAFTSMAIMNVPVELCSAGALLRFYRRFVGHARFDVGFADGGLGDLFSPPSRAIIEQAGGRVLMGAEVRAIRGTGQGVTAVSLADGREIHARHYVSTLPAGDLGRLLPPEWTQEHACFRELSSFVPSPYVSVFLWFDQKLTNLQFWARTYCPSDLNCDFYDYSNIYRGWEDRPSHIASNIIYSHRARELDDDAIVERTLAELGEFLPKVRKARLVHSSVQRVPMAIHCPFPGTERRRPATRTPVDGLILAGDWIQTGLPSSMESAVASGWRAAEEVLRDLGHPEALFVPHRAVDGFVAIAGRLSRFFPPRMPAPPSRAP